MEGINKETDLAYSLTTSLIHRPSLLSTEVYHDGHLSSNMAARGVCDINAPPTATSL